MARLWQWTQRAANVLFFLYGAGLVVAMIRLESSLETWLFRVVAAVVAVVVTYLLTRALLSLRRSA